MAADATTKRSTLNKCRNLEGWRGAPAAAREVGEVDRTAALGDGSFGQRADDAPRCRVVDVQIGRHARAQRRDEPRVLENVHPAVAAGGGTNQFGAPERMLEFLTIAVERLPLILRASSLDVDPIRIA